MQDRVSPRAGPFTFDLGDMQEPQSPEQKGRILVDAKGLSDHRDSPNDVEERLANAPSLSEVPGTRGHQVPNFISGDESTIAQDLVEEGLEEGLNDEMAEARKINIRQAS